MTKIANVLGVPVKTLVYAFFLLLFILSLGMTVLSVDYFVEYSSFTVGITKAAAGILALAVIDDVLFWKIDTIKAITDKNVSYAIIYLANALIVAACIGFA